MKRSLKKFILLFNPTELCTVAFFVFLTILIVIFHDDTAIDPFFIANLGIIPAIVFIALYAKRHPENRVLFHFRNWYPVFFITVAYRELSILIPQMRPEDIDSVLIWFDYSIFGVHPTVYLERLEIPILTDMFQVVYCSYYFMPMILGIVIYARGDMKAFSHVLFAIIFSFYVSYIGYILFPAVGPRFSLFHLQTTALAGFFVTLPIRDFLNWLEHVMRDAFPSGHTMIPLVVLYYAWRYEKPLLVPYIPFAILIIISTIYLRYHYAVDVMAGIILTIPTVFAAEVASRWWEREEKALRVYPDVRLLRDL